MKTCEMQPLAGGPEQSASLSPQQFITTPSNRLLAFLQAEPGILARRLAWLTSQGVAAIYNHGPKLIDGFKVLGLGYGGLVLLVRQHDRLLALKLRRTDAPYDSFHREAGAIAIANASHIGPQLIASNKDCLLMEYLPGPKFIDWLHSPAATFDQTWAILHQLLDQAFHLDQVGLDHGDLRCVTEHVHVEQCPGGYRPVLIDFGKASQDRRPANLTTLTQGLFLSTTVAKTISERFPQSPLNCQMEPRRGKLIEHLRHYKGNPCRKAHGVLLNFLKA